MPAHGINPRAVSSPSQAQDKGHLGRGSGIILPPNASKQGSENMATTTTAAASPRRANRTPIRGPRGNQGPGNMPPGSSGEYANRR